MKVRVILRDLYAPTEPGLLLTAYEATRLPLKGETLRISIEDMETPLLSSTDLRRGITYASVMKYKTPVKTFYRITDIIHGVRISEHPETAVHRMADELEVSRGRFKPQEPKVSEEIVEIIVAPV